MSFNWIPEGADFFVTLRKFNPRHMPWLSPKGRELMVRFIECAQLDFDAARKKHDAEIADRRKLDKEAKKEANKLTSKAERERERVRRRALEGVDCSRCEDTGRLCRTGSICKWCMAGRKILEEEKRRLNLS